MRKSPRRVDRVDGARERSVSHHHHHRSRIALVPRVCVRFASVRSDAYFAKFRARKVAVAGGVAIDDGDLLANVKYGRISNIALKIFDLTEI